MEAADIAKLLRDPDAWKGIGGVVATVAGAIGAGRVVRRRRGAPTAVHDDTSGDASGGGGPYATRAELDAERDERRAADAAQLKLATDFHDDLMDVAKDVAVALDRTERDTSGGRRRP